MRVIYYEENDAAYIELCEIGMGGVVRTEHRAPDHLDLDFDGEGRLVGIGMDCNASARLPARLLAVAERPRPTPNADRVGWNLDLGPATPKQVQRAEDPKLGSDEA